MSELVSSSLKTLLLLRVPAYMISMDLTTNIHIQEVFHFRFFKKPKRYLLGFLLYSSF